jgi:PAS domain S-box-containing protein
VNKLQNFATASGPADWMFLQPAILDHMHDPVIVTDLAGTVIGCNRAAFEMFGYASEELIGQNVSILYPLEEALYLANTVIPAIHARGEFRSEIRTRTRSGDYLYVHLCSSLLRDSDGNPAGMVGFLIDVTAQKLGKLTLRHQGDATLSVSREVAHRPPIEEELRLTNERFGTALRNSPVEVFICSALILHSTRPRGLSRDHRRGARPSISDRHPGARLPSRVNFGNARQRIRDPRFAVDSQPGASAV